MYFAEHHLAKRQSDENRLTSVFVDFGANASISDCVTWFSSMSVPAAFSKDWPSCVAGGSYNSNDLAFISAPDLRQSSDLLRDAILKRLATNSGIALGTGLGGGWRSCNVAQECIRQTESHVPWALQVVRVEDFGSRWRFPWLFRKGLCHCPGNVRLHALDVRICFTFHQFPIFLQTAWRSMSCAPSFLW